MEYNDHLFDWEDDKAQHNRKKHQLAFEDAIRIWLRPEEMVVEQDFGDYDEDRYLAFGRLPNNTVLIVVHTYRDEIIWIISARKAEPKERKHYLETLHRPKW
jgi:uncharacterized protein